MFVYEGKDYQDISERAAQVIASEILMKPDMVLGLATGSSPVGLYEQLAKWNQEGKIDFSRVTSVNLDEYKGLSPENNQSYRYFMNHHLFDHINIDKERTFVPNGLESDSGKACREYDELLARLGGIDVQVLGIGANGHIGFNEPGEEFCAGTHCVQLTESTIMANARFFNSPKEVPTEAYSMGIRDIMFARKIVVIATGEQKAKALYDTICGPITPHVPGSILQLHRQVAVFADEAALSLVKEKQ